MVIVMTLCNLKMYPHESSKLHLYILKQIEQSFCLERVFNLSQLGNADLKTVTNFMRNVTIICLLQYKYENTFCKFLWFFCLFHDKLKSFSNKNN